MATTNSKTEPTSKRITKIDLNQLAKSYYGEEAYCEHSRSGKRGWYLHNGSEQTFIGANATEAFNYLQSQENAMDTSASDAPVTPDAATIAPATPPSGAETEGVAMAVPATPEVATAVSTTPEEVATQTAVTPEAATEAPVTPEEVPEKLPIQPEELLEILLEKFPNTFFREPENIRPVQNYIHKKIRRVLNNEYTKDEISAAMALYTQTLDYCKKLILGGPRIDLDGNLCEEVAQQHIEDAKARIAGEKLMRPANKKKPKKPQVQLPPPQLDQLVFGKMEIGVKINELPADSKTLRNGWEEFIIDINGQMVKIVVRPKTWKKLQKASNEYSSWIANMRGKMGTRTKNGFELLTPGIQIFEKKTKNR